MRINIARPLTRLHTQLRKLTYARYAGSRLRTGTLTAHEKHRLMLLGSPPDMVHGFPLRLGNAAYRSQTTHDRSYVGNSFLL